MCKDTNNCWLFHNKPIKDARNNVITKQRHLLFHTFRVPLQSGYPEQLQNSFPELMPLRAIRLIIGFPQTGHAGAPSAALFSALEARRSAVRASVKPPSSLKVSSWFSICFPSIVMSRLQRTSMHRATVIESSDFSHGSNRCFWFRICMLLCIAHHRCNRVCPAERKPPACIPANTQTMEDSHISSAN